MSKSLF